MFGDIYYFFIYSFDKGMKKIRKTNLVIFISFLHSKKIHFN